MSTQDNPSSGRLTAFAFACLLGATIIFLFGCAGIERQNQHAIRYNSDLHGFQFNPQGSWNPFDGKP